MDKVVGGANFGFFLSVLVFTIHSLRVHQIAFNFNAFLLVIFYNIIKL